MEYNYCSIKISTVLRRREMNVDILERNIVYVVGKDSLKNRRMIRIVRNDLYIPAKIVAVEAGELEFSIFTAC